MPKYIIKIKDRFFEWSTVVDAPVTYGMTEDELRAHIKDEYGEEGVRQLPARMERIAATGTSAYGATLAEVIDGNRAGDAETQITEEEIYARYAHSPNKKMSNSDPEKTS